jgi:3'-5' exoribonuclease
MTLLDIVRTTLSDAGEVETSLPCQLTTLRPASTRNGKPYLDVEFSDGSAAEKLKIWQDSDAYDQCRDLESGACVQFTGRFWRNQFGLNIDNLQIRVLSETEAAALFSGTPERRAKIDGDFAFVESTVGAMTDPRLRMLCQAFLREYGDRFRRAAAARSFHHARRGGLIEHTSQMMRVAVALKAVYPSVNWDLVISGVLMHDSGKLWENDYEPQGFSSPITVLGELLGHITIGIELVNRFWRQLESEAEFVAAGTPSRELVREHLLHLIASHHGQREFGAPVTPRTPEGWMLHYIDNIDARYEMLSATYSEKGQVAPGIYDHRAPLEGRAIAPLPAWTPASL